MIEVYSGHTPGRRNLAAMLSGAVLVAMLSIAWLQGRSLRTLGEPVAIAGTDLTIRLPIGWVEDPRNPGTFLLPTDPGPSGDGPGVPSRRIQVAARQREFRSPYPTRSVLQGRGENRRLRDRRVSRIDPIAGMRAVEQIWDVNRNVLVRGRVLQLTQTILVREAASLRGDYIYIEYEALSDLSAGDRLLLDAICAGIRDEAPEREADPAEAMGRIGAKFEMEPGWTVADPNPPELAGLYVGPAVESDAFWSVGVFRTRFATDDLQRALTRLMSSGGIRLGIPESLRFTGPERIGDNALIGVHYRGGNPNHAIPIASLWIVSAGKNETAVVVTLARGANVEAAEQAAEHIAETIRFASGKAVTPVSDDELKQRFARGSRR